MIETLTSPSALQLVGWVLVLIVGAHLLVGLWSAAQDLRRGNVVRSLAAQELAWRVRKEELAFATRKDEVELAWDGYRKFEVQRVVRYEDAAGQIASFYLAPHDGKTLPRFQPGQFLTFRLKISGQAKDVVRCYSLSDAPDPGRFRVSIKRVPGGLASGFFHDSVNEGDILDVRSPSGRFFLDPVDKEPAVLIAGGVGVTPLLSMFNAIASQHPEREVWFFYAARSGTEFIQREHLEELATSCAAARVVFCHSNPDDADQAAIDASPALGTAAVTHCAGRVGVDLFETVLPGGCQATHHFYICGPPPMMDAIEAGLSGWKVPKEQVHMEAFGPKSVAATQPTKATPVEAAAPQSVFQVSFGRAGKVVPWDPAAESLLAFAESHGISIEAGCCAGDCHTCKTAVKSGEVGYLREPPDTPEAGTCLPCVAVPKSDLVLDA